MLITLFSIFQIIKKSHLSHLYETNIDLHIFSIRDSKNFYTLKNGADPTLQYLTSQRNRTSLSTIKNRYRDRHPPSSIRKLTVYLEIVIHRHPRENIEQISISTIIHHHPHPSPSTRKYKKTTWQSKYCFTRDWFVSGYEKYVVFSYKCESKKYSTTR